MGFVQVREKVIALEVLWYRMNNIIVYFLECYSKEKGTI